MKKKNVAKRVRNGVTLALALVSVLLVSSCKKDAQITPENSPVSVAGKLQGIKNIPASNYKVSQPISLNGAHDITISGDSISGGALSCISLVNCYNIHITHCKFVNSSLFGVDLSNCTNIIVDDSYVANVVTGVHASESKSIQVTNNNMKNITGSPQGGIEAEFENISSSAADASSNSATNNQLIQ
jgi:Right handed beta helix region